MHWKVRFAGEYLHVSLEGPRETYLERLAHLVANGSITEVGND
jgi:urease accessory protein